MSRSLVVWMPAPTAAALRAKSDWAVAVEEAAEKGLAEEEVIEEGAKEGAVPKEARGGRDRWRFGLGLCQGTRAIRILVVT